MSGGSGLVFAFGEYELDAKTFELRRAGRPLHVEPRVFDVLAYLVEHRGRVVTKDELLARFWPEVKVSEWVVPRAIAAARRALGTARAGEKRIVTVHGRGYRFAGDVVERRSGVPSDAGRETGAPGEPLVDREPVIAVLEAAFDDVSDGRGRVVLFCGEAGIGKTRVLDELVIRARAKGALVATGRASEGRGAPAFWPWIQVFRTLVDAGGEALRSRLGASAEDVAVLVPELLARPQHPPAAILALPEEARFRLFDGLATALKVAAAVRPLTLVFDDLHFADPPSLALIEFVAREIRAARILLAAAGRELAGASPLPTLAGEAHVRKLALAGLSVAGVGRFLELSTGERPPLSVIRSLHERTAGNPFFLREVARLLGENHGHAAIPAAVREVTRRRIARLTPRCRGVLEAAAVAGSEVERRTLARATKRSTASLGAALGEALDAGFLCDADGDDRLAFSHSIVREAIYEGLPRARRIALHRRIGEALARERSGDPESRLDALAHHFLEAAPSGTIDRAVAYAERAARRATALLAHETAAALYERALAALGRRRSPAARRRGELLIQLGEALSRPGDRDRAQQVFLRATAAARQARDWNLLARAALGFGGRAEFGGLPDRRLRRLLDEALAWLPPAECRLRARLLARLVGLAPHSESMPTRDVLSRSALVLARRGRDPHALIDALNARHWALLGPDGLAERLAIGAELVATGERIQSDEAALAGHGHRLGAFLESGDMAAADREIAAYTHIAEALRQPLYLWFMSRFRAVRALGDGRFADTERFAEEGFAIARRVQNPYGFAAFSGLTFYLLRDRGQLGEELEGSIRFMRENYSGLGTILRVIEVYFLAGVGRFEEARAGLERFGARDFTDLPRDEDWMLALADLAEIAALLGESKAAAALYNLLVPHAALNVMHGTLYVYLGSASRQLGLLASALGWWEDAARHFESALAMNLRIGARPACARTERDFAAMLIRSGRPADRNRARQLLARARATAGTLGMPGLGRELVDLERAARGMVSSK